MLLRIQTSGFSTLGVAAVLMIASVLLGGVYYMKGQAKTALTDKKQVIYPSEKNIPTGPVGKKIATAGGCDFLGKNPDLSKRFENTDADSCGSMPAGSTHTAALNEIKSCIDTAISTCKQTKSYIYQQGIEGSIEYLITTNNCEIFVERWGTMDPFCGSSINSCEKLSDTFPDEVCPEFIKENIPLPSAKQLAITSSPQQDQDIILCSSTADCTGKMSCAPKNEACNAETACINNECLCVDVCQ